MFFPPSACLKVLKKQPENSQSRHSQSRTLAVQNTRSPDTRNPQFQPLASDSRPLSLQTRVIHVPILKQEIKQDISFHPQTHYSITFCKLPTEMCAMYPSASQKVTFTLQSHLQPFTLHHIANPPSPHCGQPPKLTFAPTTASCTNGQVQNRPMATYRLRAFWSLSQGT